MKRIAVLSSVLAILPLAAFAQAPIFVAECAGGVNRGGYNIDSDDRGHLWVNGHRVNIQKLNNQAWEAGYHGYIFTMTTEADGSGLQVSYTGPKRQNGICTVLGEAPVSDGGE